jgi:hypothetical protein
MKAPDDRSPRHLQESKHREIFKAVFDATKTQSSARQRQTERADELKTLYERHLQALEQGVDKG